MQVAWTAGRTAPDARSQGRSRLDALPRDVAGLPPLPPSFDLALDRGLEALGLELGGDARAAIDGHVRLLLAWNEAINLTAITEPAEIAIRHVLDSLTAVELIAAGAPRPGSGPVPAAGRAGVVRPVGLRILDLGSGGGFPGLPLAAALAGSAVTLADSVAKKAAFLEVAAAATGLADRVAVRASRAEALAPTRERWSVVTARAVGSLADLVELALPLLEPGGRLIAWKRGPIADELAAASRAAAALGGGKPVVHPVTALPELAGHILVTVTKQRPTPPDYPRDPARRARQPW